jgi:aspartate-semialdehyde dehydrogenase
VVPEINPGEAAKALQRNGGKGVIANPNCSTIIALMALAPLHREAGIKRLVAATYQAASGAGHAAMVELQESTRAALDGKPFTPKVLPLPYAFNLFPHNSPWIEAEGYCEEEIKLRKETHKILGDSRPRITATCVRVPVLRAHSVSMTFECERPITPQEVKALLAKAPGVRIVDDWANNYFPMPKDASGQGDVLAGRIRKDLSDPSGKSISMFVAADQLLKGAALNAVQIAELL